jgi:hypothetical protein
MAARALCSEVSREGAERLDATASRIEHWLILEYRGLWAPDALAGSLLPDRLKAHLGEQLTALPRSRLLFVRRPDRRGRPRLACYLGSSQERAQRFFRLELDRHDDLLELDLAGALLANGPAGGSRLEHPLLLVCTHGKHDRCCARYGRPLYDALREQADETWVWQSTHVGGDRFAGNLVCLPEGLYFGRVGREHLWRLLDEYLAGRIDLSCYRGRSCYAFPVQAAEQKVREEAGLTGIDDLSLVSSERSGEGVWRVRFRARAGGGLHEVEVALELGELTYLTCGAPALARPRRFVATAHRVR